MMLIDMQLCTMASRALVNFLPPALVPNLVWSKWMMLVKLQ